MRRVLCISPHYPPDPTAGAHRMRLLAPHLAASGWQPTVLTVSPRGYEGALDESLPVMSDGVDLVRVPALAPAYSRKLGIGDLGLRSLPYLRAEAARRCRRERFDAVYITTYPIYPALLGPHLRRKFNLPFCIDLQDPWVGSWGESVGPCAGRPDWRSRLSRRLAVAMERTVLLRADAVTAVSQLTIEQAFARHGRQAPGASVELPIGWDPSDWRAPAPPEEFFDSRDGAMHFCYVGTLLPAGISVAHAFLRAVRLVIDRTPALRQAIRLHFVGTSNEARVDAAGRLMGLARANGIAELCREHPARVGFGTAVSLNRHASAVLVLGSTEPHYNASKLYTALAASRPIFALMHEASPTAAVLRHALASGGGRLVTFAEGEDLAVRVPEIADALDAVVAAVRDGVTPDAGAWLEAHSARALAQVLGRLFDAMVADSAIVQVPTRLGAKAS